MKEKLSIKNTIFLNSLAVQTVALSAVVIGDAKEAKGCLGCNHKWLIDLVDGQVK